MSGDSSDEYTPDGTRKCGVDDCSEEIFMRCYKCQSNLCDHVYTQCAEHSAGSQAIAIDDNK